MYSEHTKMKNVSILDYINTDIRIDDLDSVNEITSTSNIKNKPITENTTSKSADNIKTDLIKNDNIKTWRPYDPFEKVNYNHNKITHTAAKTFLKDRGAHFNNVHASYDYLFYYNLHLIKPRFHYIFNFIATCGNYPPEYYAIISDFILTKGSSFENPKTEMIEIV
jgi:hypothetical protein